ncbi:MAG: hypothetical protein JJ863_24195 [Deltaproteobacteria bacterium]|nr:hypothetical protein [Deltaproteobacteria bacterium]
MRSFHSLVLLSVAVIFASACKDDDPPPADTGCTEDAQCDDGVFCNGAETCDPMAAGASSLGCVAGESPCPAGDACIETDDSCDAACETPDGDGDGVDRVECGGTDCDDTDADRFPGNVEICDPGHDEDCDPNTIGTLDRDRDGFIDDRCSNDGGASGTDCNDLEIGVSPAGAEVCNGRDDDCDGDVDEGVSIEGFLDADADGRGDAAESLLACPGAVRFAIEGDDCDDADLTVQPIQNEICDVKDNDCDGTVDENARAVFWYEDADGDGYGDVRGDRLLSCEPVSGYSILPTDCDDADGDVSPVGVESCNGVDDDCNGIADFTFDNGDREDDDGDGAADTGCGGDDCDDRDPFVGPGFAELCNGRDDDCDGMVDEGVTETDWYVDVDGDGWGAGPAMTMCGAGSGLVPRDGDCADTDRSVAPGGTERCNGVDDDCDGSVDEDASARCGGADALFLCADATCQVHQCEGGHGDCDFLSSNGCETDLATDFMHCGACGNTCAPGATCIDGLCNGTARFSLTPTVYVDATPLEGAYLYALQTGPMVTATTDASGVSSPLALSASTPVVVEGPGLLPTIYPMRGDSFLGRSFITPGIVPASDIDLYPFSEADLSALGVSTEPGRGHIVVVNDSSLSGGAEAFASVNLDANSPVAGTSFHPSTGTFTHPVIRTGNDRFDETSEFLIFANARPGRIELTSRDCTIEGEDAGRVYDGMVTIVNVQCL